MTKKHSIPLILAVLILAAPGVAQKKADPAKQPIRSAGIVNGRAKNLVVPNWPPAARLTNTHGTVRVEIVIDQDGKVEEVKTVQGPVILRRVSMKAALESTFNPIRLQGEPIRVSGIILYNYIPESYNWLEIGFAEPFHTEWSRLPDGFEQVSALRDALRSSLWGENPGEEAILTAAVENALVNDYKMLWLFRVGMSLNRIWLRNTGDEETLARVGDDVERLLITKPDKASALLLQKMGRILKLIRDPELNTVDPIRGSRLYEEMTEFRYMASVYGR